MFSSVLPVQQMSQGLRSLEAAQGIGGGMLRKKLTTRLFEGRLWLRARNSVDEEWGSHCDPNRLGYRIFDIRVNQDAGIVPHHCADD